MKREKMNNPGTIDPNNPTPLTRFTNEVEAATILSALAENGIHGTTTGSFTAGFRTEAPGDVTVVVRHCDLQRALEVLAEVEAARKNIDWSAVDVGVPEA